MKSTVLLLSFLLILVTPFVSLAAESGTTTLEEEFAFLEAESTVQTASRYVQKLSEAPSAVTIVTADEIKKFGYRSLTNILKSVRGFYTYYDRNYDYLGMRGFLRPGDYNTRFLFLIDGVRVNDSVYDTVGIGTDFFLDVDLIDRIEIVRGPGSSLYGTNALFGVINVITRKGSDFRGFEVSGDAGSFNTYKARLSYGDSFPNGMDLVLSGSYYASDGDDRLYYEEFDDEETNFGVAEDLDDDMFYSFFGRLSLQDFELEGAYVHREKDIPTGAYEVVFNDPDTKTMDEQAFIALKYEHIYPGQLGLKGQIYYAYYDYDGDYAYDWAEEEDEEPYIVTNKDYSRAKWWGIEAQFEKTLLADHKLIAGGEYRDNFQQDQGNYDEEIYLDDRRSSTVWAVFIQDEFSVLSNLILNAGVRYDRYSTFGGTTNPRLALIYNPMEKTTLKLMYGTAFRTPNAYEQYYHDGWATTKPNPDLDPETIETYEAVLEHYIGDNLKGTVNGFYYKMEDLITLTTDPEDELLVFRNMEKVESRGLELELEGKWPSGMGGRISYAYQDSENSATGEELVDSPEHLAKLNVIVPVLAEKLFLGLEEQYTSKRKTISGNYTDGFYTTNVTLFGQNLVTGLEASISVYNLFDEEYSDPGSEEHLQDAIEQDGRTFNVTFTYNF